MSSLPEQTEAINNPATPVAASAPDTQKLVTVIETKLDLAQAEVKVAKFEASQKRASQTTGGRAPASEPSTIPNKSKRHLWCYEDPKHPRVRFLSTKITYPTLAKRADEYSEAVQSYYQKSNERLTSHKIKKGESLRSLSRKLVGTEDIWIELYLLNKSVIPDWDNVTPGTELRVPVSAKLPVTCGSNVAGL